jgi:hypothetical protein
MAAPVDQVVNIKLKHTAEGQEVMAQEAAAQTHLETSIDKTTRAQIRQEAQNIKSLLAFRVLDGGIRGVAESTQYFFGQNEALSRGIATTSAALQGIVGVIQIAKAAQALYTAELWATAAGQVAAGGLYAPVIAAVILAAVATLAAYKAYEARPMAMGGPVSSGSPYYVGERGPELFVPSSSGMIVPSGGGGASIGNINITVMTNDPDEIGRALSDAIRRHVNFGGA